MTVVEWGTVNGMRPLLPVVLGAAIGCGSPGNDPAPQPAGTCAARSGTYRVSYVHQSGDCGAMTEQIFTVGIAGPPVGGPAPTGCNDMGSESADRCSTAIHYSCADFSERGTVDWDTAGNLGSGKVTIAWQTTTRFCMSFYDVTYVRQ
jgi:hypothetical protein